MLKKWTNITSRLVCPKSSSDYVFHSVWRYIFIEQNNLGRMITCNGLSAKNLLALMTHYTPFKICMHMKYNVSPFNTINDVQYKNNQPWIDHIILFQILWTETAVRGEILVLYLFTSVYVCMSGHKAPSTRMRILFFSGLALRSHVNGVFGKQKRKFSKTIFRVNTILIRETV